MKRKKQLVLFVFLIIGLSLFYIRMNDLFLDKEELFYAFERGNLCGPSEEIVLEEEREDGSVMMVGRQRDALYMLSMERALGIFWKYQNGSDNGYFEMLEEIDGYILNDGRYIGLCRVPEVVEVEIYFGVWRERQAETVHIDVGKGGLLYADTGLDGMEFMDWCVKGKNADGEVIYERWRQGGYEDQYKEQWEEIQQQK